MAPPSDSLTHTLLARAHSPDTTSRIYADKIQYRQLYLKPTSPPPHQTAADARASRRRARESKKRARQKLRPAPLSSRDRRRLGLDELPRGRQRYALFQPLNRLWLGYAREILGGELYNGGQGAAAKLSAAEFQGAEVEVARSGCPSRVGIRGIVVKDAKFVFEIVTPKNQLKIVPKEGTMFRVEIPVEEPNQTTDGRGQPEQTGKGEEGSTPYSPPRRFVFEIHGDQFLARGADRANKKFKAHFLKNV